jgi:hypothetical protein
MIFISSSAGAVTLTSDWSDGIRDVAHTSVSSASFGPAWDSEFAQSDEVPGSKITGGQYSQQPHNNNPSSAVLRVASTASDGELIDKLVYGIFKKDTCDKSYTGTPFEPCGRYVVNSKNLLTQWTANQSRGLSSTSDWSNGGVGTVSASSVQTYNNAAFSFQLVNSGAGTGSMYQTVLTASNDYRATGFVRGDTGLTPKVTCNSVVLWTGTATATWQYFDTGDFTAGATSIHFENVSLGAGSIYWDGLLVTKANDTTGWTPFAANRSCSAFLMGPVISGNSNRTARRQQSAWSSPV